MSDPFKIDGPTCISFSGGRTSAYMLWRVLQSNGGLPDECVVCFANTGKEEEATLRFVRDCGERWGVPITWLEFDYHEDTSKRFKIVDFASASRNGEPFEQAIFKLRKNGYLPNPVTRFCTIELKIRPMARRLLSLGMCENMAEGERMSWIGIRADEPRRVAKIADKARIPLANAGVTVADVGAFWGAQPFNLELPTYKGRTLAGNCDLCFLKPLNQIATLIAQKPERAIWWAEMERRVQSSGMTPGDGGRFRKDRPSYAQMAANARDQTDFIGYDDEPIACYCGE